MASTARELFDAARRQYAKREGGKLLTTLYIGVPHQLPPLMKDSDSHPPEQDGVMPDRYVAGDHDCRAVMRVVDGLTYQGHQSAEVRRLAEEELDTWLTPHWQEEVLCQLYAGHPLDDPDFKRLSNDFQWHGLYPLVDGDFELTGGVVDSDAEGYLNVYHDAMMSEEDAREAGLVVEDGSVYRKEVSDEP